MNRCFFFVFLIGLAAKGSSADFSIATWSGFYNLYPYYSIYDGTSWSTPLTIGNPGDNQAASTIFTAFNSISGQTMAVWGDQTTLRPVYAIFSNGSWSTPTFISSDESITSSIIYVSFDPVRQVFLATWPNTQTSPGTPYYSVYSNGIWNTPIAIAGGVGTNNSVTSSFNPNTATMLVTWQNNAGPDGFYAIYSGTMSAGFAFETTIPLSADIFSTFDAATNETIAVWSGNSNSSGYSSAYSGSWTAPLTIPTTSASIYEDVTCSYNPLLQQVIATWVDGTDHHAAPLYSTYNGSAWTTDQQISDTFLTCNNVFSSFNNTIQKTIAVMVDDALTTTQPVYSIYNGIIWSDLNYITTDPTYAVRAEVYIGSTRLLNAPSNISGDRKKNDFGLVYEYYDTIKWSFVNSSSVVAYNIYANGIQIAQVGPQINQYVIHNRQEFASIVYGVTTVNSAGNESPPVTVTVN